MFMSVRLVILVVALILAFPVVSMKQAIDSARLERDQWLSDPMPAQLVAIVSDAAARKDVDAVDRALKYAVDSRAGVSVARWDFGDMHLEVMQRGNLSGIPPAPRWFSSYLGMIPGQQVHKLARGGVEHGTLTLEIERTIVADTLWSQMVSIFATAAAALLLFGVAGSAVRLGAARSIRSLSLALEGSPSDAEELLQGHTGRGDLAPLARAILERVTAYSESMSRATQCEDLTNGLIDAALDAVICIDEFGRITEWNRWAEDTFGWAREEVLGGELAGFVIPERLRESHRQGMRAMKISGKSRMAGSRVEMPALRRDGTEILVEMGIVRATVGGRSAFVSHLRDITELRVASSKLQEDRDLLTKVASTRKEEIELVSERLRAALEREKQSGQMRMRFVETVSHEFRTPLTVISMAASLLEKKDVQLEQSVRTRHFGSIRNSVDRLTEILDETLAMQKLASDRLKKDLQPTLLAYWLDELCAELIPERKAAEKVLIRCEDGLENPLTVDRHLLKYALAGVVKNANAFSAPDVPLEIIVRLSGERLVLEVADQGVGVPADDVERIFEPFYRGRNVMHIPGAGLGLSIVKGAVDLLGGEVSFYSSPGVGSVVTLSVPLAQG